MGAAIPPLEAIKMATHNNAIILRREHEVGSIQKGKTADLLIVKGDPSTRISNTRNIVHVIKGGSKSGSVETLRSVITKVPPSNISGIELLEKIKSNNLQTPVIVLTSDIQTPVAERCRELGARAFLNKPVNRDELRQSVRQSLAHRKELTR